jgi:diguanylate cyclase (GGDEF)-like protein
VTDLDYARLADESQLAVAARHAGAAVAGRAISVPFFWVAAALVALFSAGFLTWIVLGIGGNQTTTSVDDFGEMVAAFAGGSLCVWAGFQAADRRRRPWFLLGAAALSWGAGEAVWGILEVFMHHPNPFPSPADAGFLLAVPLEIAAVISFFPAGQGGSRLRIGLDAGVLALALFFVSWTFVLERTVAAGGSGLLDFGLSVAYPVADVVTLLILLYALSRAPAVDGALALVSLGLAFLTVSDSAFTYLNSLNNYNTTPANAGWVVGFLLLGLGALRSRVGSGLQPQDAPLSRLRQVIPYVPLVGAALVGGYLAATGRSLGTVGVATVVVLVLVVLARQFSALTDVSRLTNQLEASVAILREQEEKLRHQAFHDPLTGLANRELFRNRLDQALAQSRRAGQPIAVAYVDLDNFKDVNDTFGHDAGDRVLVSVAERLSNSIRPGDTAARLGGDEFAVLLPTVEDKAVVDAVAERLRQSFEKPFPQASTIKLTATIGTAMSGPESDPDSLLESADKAMYAAKRPSR